MRGGRGEGGEWRGGREGGGRRGGTRSSAWSKTVLVIVTIVPPITEIPLEHGLLPRHLIECSIPLMVCFESKIVG